VTVIWLELNIVWPNESHLAQFADVETFADDDHASARSRNWSLT
jgi:hypothetical protein